MTLDLLKELDGCRTAVLIGHVRPDGDCVGSCLGLWNYLKGIRPSLKVDVCLEPFAQTFQILNGAEQVLVDVPETEYDICVSLDASDKARLGERVVLFDRAKRTLCIDHHITNTGFAHKNYILPKASSTAEVICGLMDMDKIDKQTAECLYMGMVHDTGVFKHSNTSGDTMRVAGSLLEKGIDAPFIIDYTFYKKTYVQNQILGRALMESILFMNKKCIFSVLKKKEQDFYGVTPKDLDGIVDQLQVTEGVEVAIFLYETEDGNYKVSMRSSRTVNVGKVAAYFGGGGHVRAAGCTMAGTVYDVINNLSKHIAEQLGM